MVAQKQKIPRSIWDTRFAVCAALRTSDPAGEFDMRCFAWEIFCAARHCVEPSSARLA